MAAVNMWWFNAGVAPVYRSYTLALAIGDAVIPLDADIRRWLPGDAVSKIRLPCLGSLHRDGTRYVSGSSIRPRGGPPFNCQLQAGSLTGGIRWGRSSWTNVDARTVFRPLRRGHE